MWRLILFVTVNIIILWNLQECQEENATMRSELPLPFVVFTTTAGFKMSSSRERNKQEKQTSKRRSKEKQRHQAMSQGFYDQPRQQGDCDMDWRLFQPPPEKIPKTDDSDVRRGESLSWCFCQSV